MSTMFKRIIKFFLGVACLSFTFTACKTPSVVERTANTAVPASFNGSQDTTNTAAIHWKEYFTDPNLLALIDTALQNNQELNIILQEIEIYRNEVRARKGEYLPFVDVRGGVGVDKPGRFTRPGAVEATTDIEPGREMPEPLQDYFVGVFANWEVDIWHKLRNSKKAAALRYLSSVEGRNFMLTNLVAEIANAYYELLALDNQLETLQQNIEIQTKAFKIIQQQKQAARVTELAVRRFEAQVLNTRSLLYRIQQDIIETENRINFLLGRYPQPIPRNSDSFDDLVPTIVFAGIPVQLLDNRPDIKQAELELAAAKLDVKSAKANFYPSLGLSAGVGLQAFNPAYLIKSPESMLISLAGDLVAPLVNRNAIKATYYSANARQLQAVYDFEQTILNAYLEVVNQVSKINKLEQSYALKDLEVKALNRSIDISNYLFTSARADYMEVLMTQREALESRFELIETKREQLNASVNLYQALGGGWN